MLKALNLGLAIMLMALMGCESSLITGPKSYYEGIPSDGQVAQPSVVSAHAPKDQLRQDFAGGLEIRATVDTSIRPYPEEALIGEAFPNAQVDIDIKFRSSTVTVDPSLIVLDMAGVRHRPFMLAPDEKTASGRSATYFSTDVVTYFHDTSWKRRSSYLLYKLRTQDYRNARIVFLPGALRVNGQLMPELSYRFEYVRREHSYRITYR